MSVVVSSNVQEEYEDDFEKDLDWLINEESKSEEQDDEDIEAQIDRELEEDEERGGDADEGRREKDTDDDDGEEERWPTPMEPLEGPFDSDVTTEQTEDDEELEEEKKMMLQKIEQANRQLRDQEAPDKTRRRRLQFKDTLVDLVVPAQDYSSNSLERPVTSPTVPRMDSEVDGDVSGQMLKLSISPQGEIEAADAGREGAREGRVLVEKDGKFDLVSLREVESQGLLPPLPGPYNESHRGSPRQTESNKSPSSSLNPAASEPLYTPKPPSRPRVRPNSASHTQRAAGQLGSKRRVQSANGAPTYATFTLSPLQKQQLTKQQERRERMAREEEERKREEEEQKRQENELAFRAWLLKKRQQLHEEKRVHRAQEMEKMSCKRECCDPEEAFKLWLQRKHEQQLKEKQLEEMKKLEQESSIYIHRPEECEKAFRLWLRRKRLEKRVEQQAARERSRRLVVEERRARRMRDLLSTVNEIQSFRFTDPYSYRF
ncbi:coiled-coil domain-containing protein 181 isoform X3 [Salminus brasiliensis]